MKRLIVTVLMALIVTAAVGCSKEKKSPDITAATVTPTQPGSISPEATPEAPDGPKDNGNTGNNDIKTPSPTQPGDVTGTETSPAPTDVQTEPTPTGKDDRDNETTGTPDDGNGQPGENDADDDDPDDGDEEDKAVIEGYWNESFLIWLPGITSGKFERFESDETHDYITLSNISAKNVKSYINKLTKGGFSTDAVYTDFDGGVSEFSESTPFRYSAYNKDGWNVQLDYDPDSRVLTIGSGYDAEKDEDEYSTLREETAIGILPEFDYGDFDSSKEEDGIVYCIFSNVDPACEEYVGKLKKAGFTLEADEGSEDGIIWYNASDADGRVCEFIYTEGAARIGCGLK